MNKAHLSLTNWMKYIHSLHFYLGQVNMHSQHDSTGTLLGLLEMYNSEPKGTARLEPISLKHCTHCTKKNINLDSWLSSGIVQYSSLTTGPLSPQTWGRWMLWLIKPAGSHLYLYKVGHRAKCRSCGYYLKIENMHGLYSLSGKTSYRHISWGLEAARLHVIMMVSLWNLTGILAAVLPRCLLNVRAIGKVQTRISRLRGLAVRRLAA